MKRHFCTPRVIHSFEARDCPLVVLVLAGVFSQIFPLAYVSIDFPVFFLWMAVYKVWIVFVCQEPLFLLESPPFISSPQLAVQ